jgi:large subunit ribosomal protein L11
MLGTCVSLGVTVEGKDPREVQKDIDAGKYEELFGSE